MIGLISACRDFLLTRDAAELAPFLAGWPRTPAQRQVVPASLPVVRWLAELERAAGGDCADLLASLRRAESHLAWRQSYSEGETGFEFLQSYGWTEIVGLDGIATSDRIACGILLLGPKTLYPRHRHEAEEIYVPLSGTAEWLQGDARWRRHEPGTVIHHARHEPHAMRTGAAALAALYVWRSDDLAQRAHLDPADGPG